MHRLQHDGGVFASDEGVEPTGHDDALPLAYAMDDYASFRQPMADTAISGAELRRRLITPEALAAMGADAPRPSLLERLLKRLRPTR